VSERPSPWAPAAGTARDAHAVHITSDAAVEESTSTGAHHGVLHSPADDVPPTGRHVTVDYIQVLRFRDGRHT
jgi:ketosteroid isomerase-like protein